MEVLPKRFGKYELSIHPDKTRLAPFARPQEQKGRGGTGVGEPTRDV
jgi:RNA-directed DNA polymerase